MIVTQRNHVLKKQNKQTSDSLLVAKIYDLQYLCAGFLWDFVLFSVLKHGRTLKASRPQP